MASKNTPAGRPAGSLPSEILRIAVGDIARRTLALAVALAWLAIGSSAAHAEGYLSAYEDLPVAPGLIEVAGSGLSFDTPTGRIVEAYARGKGTPASVLKFYDSALPQLGWTKESDTRYRREAEVLRLDLTTEDRVLVMRVTVSPE